MAGVRPILLGGCGALLGAAAVALPLPLLVVVGDVLLIPDSWRGGDLFGLGVLTLGASALVAAPIGMRLGVARATRPLGQRRRPARQAMLLCQPVALALFAVYRLNEEARLASPFWPTGTRAAGGSLLWPLLTGVLAVRCASQGSAPPESGP